METVSSVLTVFLLMLGASAVPGPSDMLVMHQAIRNGFTSCLRFIVGIVAADAVFILAACLGWMSLFTRFPEVGKGAQWAGAVFLLWVAWRSWSAGDPEHPEGKSISAVTGFLVTFADPTAIGFYAAVLPVLSRGRPVSPLDGLMLFGCAVVAILLMKCTEAVLAIRIGARVAESQGFAVLRRLARLLFLSAFLLFILTTLF
jgi:threonine/homoserine/homoserine lactone efflux protein